MDSALIRSAQIEDKIKKQLQQSILRKRQVLSQWMEKVESLKIELELIKNEYTVRIGYLLLKDNQLDLEIIQCKNLKRLMDEGMTYEEAVQAEENTFYNEILRMQKEQEKIDEEKTFFEKRQEIPEEIQEDIKILWKKLIRKFHPDLVIDKQEKRKRETIMKVVNKAYAEGDIESLQHLVNTMEMADIEVSTKERLEVILFQIENLIQGAKETFKDLRESEWYMWKKKKEKAKKLLSGQDIFAELEKNLLDDVVKKFTILKELRNELGEERG